MGVNERLRLSSETSQAVVPLENSWADLLEPVWIADLDSTVFLSRCRSGQVTLAELHRFVVQQHFYSRHFTRYLHALLSNMENESDRMELTKNLLEEIGLDEQAGRPHSVIYRQMMERMGCHPKLESPLPSTQRLVETMYEACRHSNPLVGLAAMCLGAEAIVPHLYSQIVMGFQSQGESLENLDFFRIHIECDDGHAITMRNIIDREMARDRSQAKILKETAYRLIQARTGFFEGISSQNVLTTRLIEVRHDGIQFQGF